MTVILVLRCISHLSDHISESLRSYLQIPPIIFPNLSDHISKSLWSYFQIPPIIFPNLSDHISKEWDSNAVSLKWSNHDKLPQIKIFLLFRSLQLSLLNTKHNTPFGTIQRSQRWCHQHCYLAVASYDKLSQMELLFFSSYEIKSISVRKLFEKLKAFRSIRRHKSFSWIWTDSQISLSFNIHQAALSNLPQLIKRQTLKFNLNPLKFMRKPAVLAAQIHYICNSSLSHSLSHPIPYIKSKTVGLRIFIKLLEAVVAMILRILVYEK